MKNIRNSFLAGIVVSLMAAPVFAGGPLNLNAGDPDGVERWPGGGANIPFNPDQGGIAAYMDAATVAAAFAQWQGVATATATYSNNGMLPADITVSNFCSPPPFNPSPAVIGPGCHLIGNLFFGQNVSDGLSPIVFDDDGSIFFTLFGSSGVLGFASTDTRAAGTPIEAVMFLNGATGFPAADFFGVQVHEAGHYSGLAHTVTNGEQVFFGDQSGPTPDNTYGFTPIDQVETMYPFAAPGVAVFAATPHADDVGIISFLYPELGFFGGSATVTGTVLAPNNVTPVTGVNVIARNVDDPLAPIPSMFVDAVSSISGDRGTPGVFTLNGLTPGANYEIFIDQILAGGFSTPPTALSGPEEFYNGADESNNVDSPDDVLDRVAVATVAGATSSGIDIIFNSPAPGDPLLVGDDGFVELFLPFTFSICDQDFDSVFVNANGNLTFGSGDNDFSESSAELLSDQPRIAALWDDLSPYNLITGAQQGLVTFDQSKNDFTVIFEDVPEFLTTGSNSFEITLKRSNNHVDIEYGDVSAADGLAGISCGGAITSGFEASEDLSANGPKRMRLKNEPARYEVFSFGNPNDSANSAYLFSGGTDYNDNWTDEPNDSIADARHLNLPFNSIPIPRYTELNPTGGDVDYFEISLSAGTTFVAEIIGGQLDSLIGLFDSGGALIAVDDDGGAGLLSKLAVPITADGLYYLAVSSFPDFGFTGAGGSGGRYVLDAFAIDGILLSLGDDDFEEVTLDFSFPFNGSSYGSVFVNSNGNLTFGSGDTDFSETVGEFLADQPRIAPLWDDLSPNNGGTVIAELNPTEATITFDSVPEFISTGSNTFMVTLREDGTFTIEYGAVSAGDGIAGTTPGGGIAGGPGAVDLSAEPQPLGAAGSTYEVNPGDLSGLTLDFEP